MSLTSHPLLLLSQPRKITGFLVHNWSYAFLVTALFLLVIATGEREESNTFLYFVFGVITAVALVMGVKKHER
jgi:hypothetical protein